MSQIAGINLGDQRKSTLSTKTKCHSPRPERTVRPLDSIVAKFSAQSALPVQGDHSSCTIPLQPAHLAVFISGFQTIAPGHDLAHFASISASVPNSLDPALPRKSIIEGGTTGQKQANHQ
jgi:hypothetical protein